MKGYVFGILALWIGVASLVLAVAPPIVMKKPLPIIGQEPEPGSGNALTADQIANRDRTLMWFSISVAVTSLFVLVLATISFVRGEDIVFSSLGIAFTCIALAWQYILIGLAVVAVIISFLPRLLGELQPSKAPPIKDA